jgi:hypothetical protein
MAAKVLEPQKVVAFPSPTVTAEKNKPHPLTAILRNYPGDWSDGLLPLPCLMRVKVQYAEQLVVTQAVIDAVRQDIGRIANDLPQEYQQPYAYLLGNLADPHILGEMNVARIIEYYILVACRFILDEIRYEQRSEREVNLQGVVLPPKGPTKEYFKTQIMVFHDLGHPLDPLLVDCLGLATERVKAILAGRQMDMLGILKKKYYKYSPNPKRRRARGHLNSLVRFLRSSLAMLVAST